MIAGRSADAQTAISIIIPSYNGRHLLERCLPAVQAAIDKIGECVVEVIVVDDASTDGTDQWLHTHWPDVTVIPLLSNSGFTRAINAGILASRGEWLGLLNNDTAVDENWISAVLPEMRDGIGSIATLILYQENRGIDSAGDSYTVIGTALKRGHLQADYDTGVINPPLFSACAASAFYRRSALVSVGLFDEYLGAYYDDIDVGFRLQLAGFETVYTPASICHHVGNASYRGRGFQVWYQTSRNSEIVFWSNMPAPLLLRYGLSHALFSILQIGPMIWAGNFWAYILGKLSVLGFLPYIFRKRKIVKKLTRRTVNELRRYCAVNWIRLHFRSGFPGLAPAAKRNQKK